MREEWQCQKEGVSVRGSALAPGDKRCAHLTSHFSLLTNVLPDTDTLLQLPTLFLHSFQHPSHPPEFLVSFLKKLLDGLLDQVIQVR